MYQTAMAWSIYTDPNARPVRSIRSTRSSTRSLGLGGSPGTPIREAQPSRKALARSPCSPYYVAALPFPKSPHSSPNLSPIELRSRSTAVGHILDSEYESLSWGHSSILCGGRPRDRGVVSIGQHRRQIASGLAPDSESECSRGKDTCMNTNTSTCQHTQMLVSCSGSGSGCGSSGSDFV